MAVLASAPDRSYEQRLDALERANMIRSARAALKRELKLGEQSVRFVLAAPAPEFETMRVFDLLLAVPKMGRVKANKILARCQISPSKTLGGLSERQRCELLGWLPR